jgi:transposase
MRVRKKYDHGLIDAEQVARKLGINIGSVYQYAHRYQLGSSCKLHGKKRARRLFSASDVALMRKRKGKVGKCYWNISRIKSWLKTSSPGSEIKIKLSRGRIAVKVGNSPGPLNAGAKGNLLRVWKIQAGHGSGWCTEKDFEKVLEWLEDIEEYDIMTIRVSEMTGDEYNSLPEFTGP